MMLGLGLALGYLLGNAGTASSLATVSQSFRALEEKGTSYTFVHPLLGFRTPAAVTLGQYTDLNAKLQALVTGARREGLTRASIYFRDLGTGLWVGINENDTYYPASLLKVPVMIAYEQQAEENPGILDQPVTYSPSLIPPDPFDATSTLIAGRAYTVRSLISSMVVDSDNGATFALLSHINPDYLDSVYNSLGIPNPDSDSSTYQISARTYGLFFRILYNATYLSPDSSERALELLSHTTFNDGLVAGVPEGTPVAHKWGEHVLSSDGKNATGVELSDCGIVYYLQHPYLLCVMTSGQDVPTDESFIKSASSITYAAVVSRYATSTSAF